MPDLSFDRLCSLLATTHGGYTVWLGAGAAIALTRGKAPSWQNLADDIIEPGARPSNWEKLDLPEKLDWAAGSIGHAAFRRNLRRCIVDTVYGSELDDAIIRSMAIIGARASAVVSFNIEALSALPFVVAFGGSLAMRVYLRPEEPSIYDGWSSPGPMARPIYFPHGLLDLYGNCVITQSEYDRHRMSLAVSTAVNMCLGGDLLIVGMSLGDRYLRDAILEHRAWIRSIFWVTNSEFHSEWARVARVNRVHADHENLWNKIADAHVLHANGKFEHLDEENGLLSVAARSPKILKEHVRVTVQTVLDGASKLIAEPSYTTREFARFARQMEGLGIEIPEIFQKDPRYEACYTEGPEPGVYALGSVDTGRDDIK